MVYFYQDVRILKHNNYGSKLIISNCWIDVRFIFSLVSCCYSWHIYSYHMFFFSLLFFFPKARLSQRTRYPGHPQMEPVASEETDTGAEVSLLCSESVEESLHCYILFISPFSVLSDQANQHSPNEWRGVVQVSYPFGLFRLFGLTMVLAPADHLILLLSMFNCLFLTWGNVCCTAFLQQLPPLIKDVSLCLCVKVPSQALPHQR